MTTDVTPATLADLVAPLLDDALVAFDVDGVLAPIVEHADQSRLTAGVAEHLEGLAHRAQVVIVSGRSLADLERLFGFPTSIDVVGSHGLEMRGREELRLDDDERFLLQQLEAIGRQAVGAAGDGAWLEVKPASVVVHTRTADRERARPAIDAVERFANVLHGAEVKRGHEVVELLARSTSKGAAIAGLRRAGQPVVFLGDDVTDESVFEVMGDGDVSVRVGPGTTAARLRLRDPDEVADFVGRLVSG